MTLTRRPVDRSTLPLRSALERLVGDWPLLSVDGALTELAPAVDVRETENAYEIDVDLPGVRVEDIEVLVEGRTVTIRGRFSDENEEKRGNYMLRERRRGEFIRAVALPGMVEVDQVTSRSENGQLTITLPKASQNRARRIQIDRGEQSTRGDGRGQQSGGERGTRARQSAADQGTRDAGSSGAADEAGARR